MFIDWPLVLDVHMAFCFGDSRITTVLPIRDHWADGLPLEARDTIHWP